jgi:hypothetical protein
MYSLRINTIWFSILCFFVIYYNFSKLLQGMICHVLESSGGKKSIFIGWGVMCSNPLRLEGEVYIQPQSILMHIKSHSIPMTFSQLFVGIVPSS